MKGSSNSITLNQDFATFIIMVFMGDAFVWYQKWNPSRFL